MDTAASVYRCCLCILSWTCEKNTLKTQLVFSFSRSRHFRNRRAEASRAFISTLFFVLLEFGCDFIATRFFTWNETHRHEPRAPKQPGLSFSIDFSSFFWFLAVQMLEVLIRSIIFTSCIAMWIRFSATDDKKGSVFVECRRKWEKSIVDSLMHKSEYKPAATK